ncbi:MAG: PSD1 and planctomycete cytochrome C domain-containing protein [Opitutaceae bacterium]|nr:PSD1 and planctomycete cytochrome C domain-containing protein [Opitutaceae bacterium]
MAIHTLTPRHYVLPAQQLLRATITTLLPLLATSAFGAVDFNRDIKPILADRCYECHGPDKHKSGLRLDRKEDALAGGDSGAVIIPGQSAKSLLFTHVSGADPDLVMPPEGDPLTPAQVALLRAWIDEGAPWPDDGPGSDLKRSPHWAFQASVRPDVPAVNNSTWSRNTVDRFILARLEREKLSPSPEADRVTLLRRLSFDLLGLPPRLEDVRQFLADPAPDAYERMVDRLLASPHFGERWGRHWLDLARYADSDGYEKDSPRPFAYLYRDWVIDAINRDVPFDQFTIEQLAGDLLPGVTKKQKIATGFHRQTLINKEGGVDPEEFRVKAVVDRVSTTGTVWLGLTVGCAECHSHKYDPLTQREFYQLFAFFNNADDQDLPAPHEQELQKYQVAKVAWDAQRAPLKKKYDDYIRDALPAKQAEWEAAGKLELAVWSMLEPRSAVAANGTTLTVKTDKSVAASDMRPLTETYTVEAEASAAGTIAALRLEVIPEEGGKGGPGRSGNGNFVLTDFTVKLRRASGGEPRRIDLECVSADFSQKDWHVSGTIDGDSKTGWSVAPQTKQRHAAVFQLAEPLSLGAGDQLVFTLDQQFGNQHTVARFRLSATNSPSFLPATLVDDLVAIGWNTPAEKRTDEQRKALMSYYRDEVDAEARKLRKPLQDLAKKEPKYPETKAAIMAERSSPRKSHIHVRGDFQRPGPTVQPATPAVLHALKARGEKPDRLDLAHWLVDEGNPLTRRVTVNHIWKSLFGRGLVASASDFGTRGERPTHPELLDWLATEFSRLGWSRKAMIKLIVTSATYRQASVYRDDLIDVDPLNTLLARQNRLRLEAEIVRDAHLAASGLLAAKIGGPSVRPPLPADIAALGYANSVKWQESEGEDRFRRGMYIFFQRTVPYPMLMTFDAPNSNTTCTRRERSNTPLQALTLWNDPVFFDCARALGERLMAEPTVESRLEGAFEQCLGRAPTAAELARLRRFYDDQLRLTQEQPASALAILGREGDVPVPLQPADQATLVAAVRTIMNLDEFITRE